MSFSSLLPYAATVYLLLTAPALAAEAKPYRPQVGQPHMNFTLPRIDNGEPVSLEDFRGKKVLLIQFASW